jgi:iron-sulfur cluster assembly accessory protein
MYKLSRALNISVNAWSKMQSIHKQTKYDTFLFAANAGGCSGLNYDFKNIDPITISEMAKESKIPLTFLENNGLKVYIDPLSEMYLLGTTIDYISENYEKGIYESKFSFKPNNDIAGTCGCGISFYLKE